MHCPCIVHISCLLLNSCIPSMTIPNPNLTYSAALLINAAYNRNTNDHEPRPPTWYHIVTNFRQLL